MRKAFLVVFILISGPNMFAQDIRIICPYLGPITNTYRNDERKLDLKDNSLLKGVFFQWVSPDRYQWNAFIYQSSDINYSTIWGGHFIFDYYIPMGELNKIVLGAGIEYIRIDMDADSSIYPLKNLEILNNVYIPYIRAGYRIENKNDLIKFSVLPWFGIEDEIVKGDVNVSVDPPGPAPLIVAKEDIDAHNYYAMVGLNLNAHIYHAFEFELKYYGAFDKKYFSTANAMINIFLSRNFGISYRTKYMEIDNGSDLYHIFGLAFVF